MLEFVCRNHLDENAERTMAVLNPLKLKITNFPTLKNIEINLFPKDKSKGSRLIELSDEIYIDKSDFREIDDSK